jgi:SAM-dependent methyltransferase
VNSALNDDRGSGDKSFGERYFMEESSYRKFRDADEADRVRHWYAGLLRLVDRLVPGVLAQCSVLEVGCGYGPMLRLLEGDGRFVVGLDISAYALGVISAARPSAPLVRANAASLPIRADSQDAVVASEVLEHLREPELLIEGAYRCLVPGGWVVATSPNPRGDFLPGYSAWADRTHVSVFPPWRWAELFRAAGFSDVRTWTVWTVPYLWRLSPRLSRTVLLPRVGPTTLIVAKKPGAIL